MAAPSVVSLCWFLSFSLISLSHCVALPLCVCAKRSQVFVFLVSQFCVYGNDYQRWTKRSQRMTMCARVCTCLARFHFDLLFFFCSSSMCGFVYRVPDLCIVNFFASSRTKKREFNLKKMMIASFQRTTFYHRPSLLALIGNNFRWLMADRSSFSIFFNNIFCSFF